MQNFIDEYDEIHDTLQNLYDYTITDKDLKKELFELIAVLEEDYKDEREKCEEALEDEARIEREQEEYSWNLNRL